MWDVCDTHTLRTTPIIIGQMVEPLEMVAANWRKIQDVSLDSGI
jgi:hypothetical protein